MNSRSPTSKCTRNVGDVEFTAMSGIVIRRRDFLMAEREDETPREQAEQLRDESFPAGVPEDADVGTGRSKGTGMPPGSVGKDQDTPQTPAT